MDEFDYDPKKAFTGKNSLEKTPVWIDEKRSYCVPEEVKLVTMKQVFTIKKAVDSNLKIDKVIDARVREILERRLEEYEGNAAKAFSNLEENPIWFNKEKGIAIKRVKISGISNGTAIRVKHDVAGELILDEHGKALGNDYVSTSNNHHIAFFTDAEGNLQEHVVSFYEATARAILGYPVIDRYYNKELGWKYSFSIKQNEFFVFPNAAVLIHAT